MFDLLYKQLLKSQYNNFIKSTLSVERQQNAKLTEILTKNKNSFIGKFLKLKNCSNISSFQEIVPLSQYEDYPKWFNLITSRDSKILTEEKILQFHLTSGTSSSSKYIPFTQGLRTEFYAGLAPWLHNLSITFPLINEGSQYWIVSPESTLDQTHNKHIGNIPVGFDKDLSYFPFPLRIFQHYKSHQQNRHIPKSNSKEYFYNQALYLLAQPNLSLISIWNPSFLILILEEIVKSKNQLIEDLKQFTKQSLSQKRRQDLSATIKHLVILSSDIKLIDWQLFWPKLQIISCWGNAWASYTFQTLKILFPKVFIQPKGLLATEGLITFPLQLNSKEPINGMLEMIEQPKQTLSINSHFYEFINSESHQIYLAHELEIGQNYQVVITTSGGLYRYRLGDLVKCTGHFNQCPLLEFISKIDLVSDICGEKLHAEHVEREFQNIHKSDLLKKAEIKLFPVLVEDILLKKPHYFLVAYTNDENIELNLELKKLSLELDQRLRSNYYYNSSRQIGQLGPIEYRISAKNTALNLGLRSTKKDYLLHTKPLNCTT